MLCAGKRIRGSAAARLGAGAVACCDFGRLELVSALHRKFREHSIQEAAYSVIHRQLAVDERQGIWNWLSLTQEVLDGVYAAFFRLPLDAFIRTGDAIHLECARRNEFTEIFSGDRHLLDAAKHFRLQGRNVTG